MVRFAQAILNGGELDGNRILQEATVKEMLTRNFSHDDRLMGMALGFSRSGASLASSASSSWPLGSSARCSFSSSYTGNVTGGDTNRTGLCWSRAITISCTVPTL